MHELSDSELMAGVRALGGIPDAVLANEELLDLLLPTLRADITLVETLRMETMAPIHVPVSVFGGTSDPEVNTDELEGWKRYTLAGFSMHLLPGNHFFVHESLQQVVDIIADRLAP